MEDAEAAVGLAVELAGCTETAQLAAQFDRLRELVGAEGVVTTASRRWMADMEVETGDPTIYRPDLMSAIGAHWGEHPLIATDLGRPRSEARRVSDLVSAGGWRRGGMFNDFYRPLGMPHELSVQLAWEPSGASCCLALHRGGRDYGERERGVLELLAPHLRAARSRLASTGSAPTKAGAGAAEAPSPTELADRLPISPREAEVLALLVAGQTADGIAYELEISRHTVVRHIEHIYAKLGVHNRATATRVALREARSPG